MTTMKAAILKAYAQPPLKLSETPIPIPANGEIIIKVLAFHVLHYTKDIIAGTRSSTRSNTLPLPLTLGGACVGRVHTVGPDTTVFQPGKLVLCDLKIRARDDETAQILLDTRPGMSEGAKKLMDEVVWRHGCMAEFVKMPLENMYAPDETMLLDSGAFELVDLPMLSTIMTPFGGLGDAGVKAGDTVIVAPATGKFGGATVMVALAMGARVAALGRSEEKLSALKKMFPSTKLLTMKLENDTMKNLEGLKKVLKNRPADVYVDFCPNEVAIGGNTPVHVEPCIKVLKRGGVVSLMGGVWGKVEIPYADIVLKNLCIRGKFTYEREQIQQVIKMAEAGNLDLMKQAEFKITRFGLNQLEEAIEAATGCQGLEASVIVTP